MNKPYHEMTPAERLADRIARNRAIDERVAVAPPPAEKSRGRKPATPSVRTHSANNPLDKFHEIKRSQGIDAATEYLEALRPAGAK